MAPVLKLKPEVRLPGDVRRLDLVLVLVLDGVRRLEAWVGFASSSDSVLVSLAGSSELLWERREPKLLRRFDLGCVRLELRRLDLPVVPVVALRLEVRVPPAEPVLAVFVVLLRTLDPVLEADFPEPWLVNLVRLVRLDWSSGLECAADIVTLQ